MIVVKMVRENIIQDCCNRGERLNSTMNTPKTARDF